MAVILPSRLAIHGPRDDIEHTGAPGEEPATRNATQITSRPGRGIPARPASECVSPGASLAGASGSYSMAAEYQPEAPASASPPVTLAGASGSYSAADPGSYVGPFPRIGDEPPTPAPSQV